MHSPATTDPHQSVDPLQRERDHLASSRAALTAMREDAQALNISDVAGTWVTAAVLHNQIQKRIASLADLVHTPLFFGRLDYLHAISSDESEGAGGERFYIGRRHVHDASGDPMVIDWRAPVSQPYYQASRTAPMDVEKRRRFGYTGGELTAYEDEHLSDPDERDTGSALLAAEIESPASARCATSSPPSSPSRTRSSAPTSPARVCVQGAPGHREDGRRPAPRRLPALRAPRPAGPHRRLVSARTARSSRYIEQVLPALGEIDVAQATVAASWWRTSRCAPRTRPTPPGSRATPGWPRCCAAPSGRGIARPPSPAW